MDERLHRLCVNTIKGLSMDAVQAANSGHPGMPMGMADVATVLWTQFLKFDPQAPSWPDRDRFVLSAGHGSMLLYSLLHLSGFDLSLDEIKNFRQWESKTPGHPEHGHTAGVETTTGPLGQGFANGVGMAIAERFMREEFGDNLVSHFTYAIVSDGDLMEGVSSEAASIAGHLKLGKLIYLYDDNMITIDGSTDLSFSENTAARFEAYHWHVQSIDGHDPQAISDAIASAQTITDKPSIICCRTVIGQGSPSYEGTSRTHGAPLGPEEVALTKTQIGLDPEQFFHVPVECKTAFQTHNGPEQRENWLQGKAQHPESARFDTWVHENPTAAMEQVSFPNFETGQSIATRKASASVLKALYAHMPNLIGGSADLAGSNGVNIGARVFSEDQFSGAGTFHFGVREHGMASVCNGIALHGGAIPYCATFLVFHDYHRPAVRMAAMMGQQVIFVYTHDSIFLGEDGPTHQPVATLLAMRSLPGLHVIRPGDAAEVTEAWKAAIRRQNGPTAIVLTRQGLPILNKINDTDDMEKGAYVVAHENGTSDIVLIATGSEVSLALKAKETLETEGIQARVVSMPCRERFHDQSTDVQQSILPADVPRLSIEAGLTLGWERYVGPNGKSIGIDQYGASAPMEVLAEKYGFSVENVVHVSKQMLGRS